MTHEDIKNVAHLVMVVVLIGKSSHRLIDAHVLKTPKKMFLQAQLTLCE